MPWQKQGGGGGPWGGGQGPWGRGPGGQRPPDIEELLRQSQDRFRRLLPGGFGSGRSLIFIVVAALVLWGISGFYRVEPEEQGVALIFGKWVATVFTASGGSGKDESRQRIARQGVAACFSSGGVWGSRALTIGFGRLF